MVPSPRPPAGLRRRTILRARPALAAALLLTLLTAGCPRTRRPSVADWLSTWAEARARVPGAAAFAAAQNPKRLCDRALGDLHAVREQLLPAPNDQIEDAAREWLEFAEAAMFECPTPVEGKASFAADLDHLDRLAAGVDTALEEAGS